MDFRQLEAYQNVYELKSFSKAAERMFLSQPSISAYIHSLEKELRTQLIHRSTKEFVPTKSGVLFYQYAKDMLSLRDNSVYALRSIANAEAGSVAIMASSVPAQYIVPELLGAFHALYPSAFFHLEQSDSLRVAEAVAAYECEIGFVGAKIENVKCAYAEIMSERLVMIAPSSHAERLAGVSADGMQDLVQTECFVMREKGSGTRAAYERCLEENGIDPLSLKISAQMSDTQSIVRAVANGLGISIVSELAAKPYLCQQKIIAIPLRGLSERKIYMVTRVGRVLTPIAEKFAQFALSFDYRGL